MDRVVNQSESIYSFSIAEYPLSNRINSPLKCRANGNVSRGGDGAVLVAKV